MYLEAKAPETRDIQIGQCKIEMVYVKGGTYKMGGDKDITLSDFWIGKYPLTQAIYEEVMKKNPSYFKGKNRPVETVNWDDAKNFLAILNERKEVKKANAIFRLPSEAEWEYAANRGMPQPLPFPEGEGKISPFGGGQGEVFTYAGSDTLHHVGWYNENSHRETKPVGMKKPNALGIYDLSGNVWEWCEDDWHADYKNAPANGSAWIDSPRDAYRVFRGGSWGNSSEACGIRRRSNNGAGYRSFGIGFRLLGVFSV